MGGSVHEQTAEPSAQLDLGAAPGASPNPARPTRLAAVGVSEGPICGVRDHATLLARGLEREHVSCPLHWLQRSGGSRSAAGAEFNAWAGGLQAELKRERPDAILLHYSVFAYSYRGVPVYVPTVLAAIAALEIPLIAIMHELAYPWRNGGWRGKVWSITQRQALRGVMRASTGVLVTADFRAEWLHSRRWLSDRPVIVAPVFSNLPAPTPGIERKHAGQVLGLFGYAYQGAAISLILDAFARLAGSGGQLRLMLLGAPGRTSSSGEEWLAHARRRGVADSISFSGTLAPQALSDALAQCDALLFADTTGPSSRKGSLAAALASGRPVVALDGRRTWTDLVRAGAARVVAPTPAALAEALAALLADREASDALGARGRAFAEERMGVAVTAEAVIDLYRTISDAAR